jgi:signal transduction histidine kinase
MARMRLRTELLIATLAIICALTGALLLFVRHTVRQEIDKQVLESTDASVHAFESVQREREVQLSRTAALLAELPTLKALMTTQHAPTIQDGSEPFWRLAGSDLFLLASPSGRVMALHLVRPGWSQDLAEVDLKKSLDQGEEASWWYSHGQLYAVFLQPITSGAGSETKQLGVLAVGYQVDASVAAQLSLVSGSQIVLATPDEVIASTLPRDETAEFQKRIAGPDFLPGTQTKDVALGADRYQAASVLLNSGTPEPVRCYVLMSLQDANAFVDRLNRTITILGITAVVLAAMFLTFVSLTITRPLDNLVAGVRALARGDYSYAIEPRGSSEVAEVGEAFSKMRGDLLESQQRWIATERVAALGRAASSISHDLRHYLAAVVANAEFLYEAEKLNLNRDDIYNEIKLAADQMTELLDSLRELAREGNSITPVPASMDQTVRHAVEAVIATPELRTRSVNVKTSGEMEGVFDPKKIGRAIFNLVLNACEATPQRQGKITVDILSFDETFEIRVIDNGSGVPEAIVSTLFDPFVSLGKPNGTGLGLAIVKKIVHDHDGRVVVEKTSKDGTVFLLNIPRAPRGVAAGAQTAVS